MNQNEPAKSNKSKSANVTTVSLRVKRETKRRILAELAKVNKKDFGKKVRPDNLIALALSLLTDQHMKSLQEASLTNADRFEQRYRDYIKSHGVTSKDEFLGKILAQNRSEQTASVAVR
jgi:hypothetical protein